MKIDLLGGDYQPRSVLASAQRRLNLYSEIIDPKQGEPGNVVHYPTPGLKLLAITPNGKPIRGLYRASNGDLYCAAAFDVYYIDKTFVFHLIGTMKHTEQLNVVKFADNGTSVILCDGTPVNGYAINMKSRTGLKPLYNPSASDQQTASSIGWLGSTYLDFSDGFLIANFIGTPTFYISNSEDTIFDPLQFASKTSYPDPVVAAVVQHRVVWLIGTLSSEVWYDTGAAGTGEPFPFEIIPGVAIDHGCKAPYSIAKGETSIFWLGQNLNGDIQVMRGAGYSVKRISTHAIEHIFSTYSRLDDAIGYCFLMNGHTMYVLTFPSADATWAFDLASGHWHQLAWTDDNGEEHRHRSSQHAFAYDLNIVNDWENGNLYALDLATYTDNLRPIKRLIGFPRMIDREGGHRVTFRNFTAEVDSGETLLPADNSTMLLAWSDDKGRTYANAIPQSLGAIGQFNKLVKWQRLGVSRNRVFRLEWTADALVTLNGAFVTIEPAGS